MLFKLFDKFAIFGGPEYGQWITMDTQYFRFVSYGFYPLGVLNGPDFFQNDFVIFGPKINIVSISKWIRKSSFNTDDGPFLH